MTTTLKWPCLIYIKWQEINTFQIFQKKRLNLGQNIRNNTIYDLKKKEFAAHVITSYVSLLKLRPRSTIFTLAE